MKQKLTKKQIEYNGFIIKYRTKKELEKKQNKIDKRLLKNRIDKWKDAIKIGNKCERCGADFTVPKSNGELRDKHPHHIISEGAVVDTYPELIDDLNNGILLCARCHKFANDSAHEGSLEFVLWLMCKKREQYDYLVSFLKEHKKPENTSKSLA